MGDGKTEWPDELMNRESSDREIAPEELSGWLDVKVLADHTEKVGRMIYYPFVILLLLIIAQNRFLENWDWPIALILVASIIAAYVLYSGFIVRGAAEKVRLMALEDLDSKIVRYSGRPATWKIACFDEKSNTWT